MRRFSVMKKESSITRGIKLQAESLNRRLDALSKQVKKSEELQGPTAVTTRIQRSQHAALHRKFQEVGIMMQTLCFGYLKQHFICICFNLNKMCCLEIRLFLIIFDTKIINLQLKSHEMKLPMTNYTLTM